MAADEERAMIKIPVFSVLKNGIILKNIFLNNPNWENTNSIQEQQEQERDDDPILIGRHPDCHIVLDHLSISRFHLEIHARPVSQSLSVIDLDSVHGTWVSGEKIGAKIAVDLVEGDTVKLGASTRVYELHWVSLSSAFEMENPLPAVLEENEETQQMENLNEFSAEVIPSAPPLPDSFSPAVEEFAERSPSFPSVIPMTESLVSSMPLIEVENKTPGNNSNATELYAESGKASSLLSRRSKSKSVSFLRVQTGRKRENISNARNEASLEEFKREETICRVLFDSKQEEEEEEEAFVSDKENLTPLNSSAQKSHTKMKAVLTLREELFHSAKENWTPESPNISTQSTPLMSYSEKKENLAPALASPVGLMNWQEEVFYSVKENLTPEVHREAITKKLIDGDCLLINEEEEKEVFASDKENLTPQISKSRKVKKPLVSEFLKVDEHAIPFALNKDKSTPEVSRSSMKSKKFLKVDEEDAFASDFTSDKENLTPVASGVKKSKKKLADSQERIEKAIMERRKERVPFQSLFENSPSKIYGSPLNLAQRTVDKEMTPLRSLLKKSPAKSHNPLKDAQRIVDKERVPFQSLLDNSSPSKKRVVDIESLPFQSLQKSPLSNKYSSCIHTQRTADEFSNFSSQSVDLMLPKGGESQKKWIMVVDTGCFLNEESRKSLQLLEGLRGTQLIIPRIVIRVLDCLKRHESLFRKETGAACSILQWIEECMVKSSWWVHVQSSLETMLIASTPPATPRSQFDEANLIEIVSPTAEDHVLDCALMFKRIKEDGGNFVLLTNSVTLKIKAMAEGLLCETPVEFRESLVNPYSKRFLWSGSSPRGSTWSCLDEVSLIENYYRQNPGIMKRTGKATESSIRVKLILLHNSHYGKTSSVI